MSKVLIVEDDHFYQKIYKHKFEISNYEVEVAGDGEECLEKVKLFRPDIILMDIMMPKMDGFATLEQLKKDDELKNIPVIMLTNLSSGADKGEVIKKGAIECLVKSDLTPDEVLAHVEKVISKN